MNKEEISKMTVPDLKAALKELNLPVTGKKDDLVQRYLAAKTSAAASTAPAAEEPEPAPAAAEAEADAAPAPVEEETALAAEATDAAEPSVAKAESKHRPIVFTDSNITNVKVQVVKPDAAAAPAEKKPVVPALSQAEKMKLRADKFKDPEDVKAIARAQRFNLVHPELEKEKELKRAERFGIAHPELEEAKKRQRAERFGVVDPETKLEQRKEKFKPLAGAAAAGGTDESEAARKKARAERFGLAS